MIVKHALGSTFRSNRSAIQLLHVDGDRVGLRPVHLPVHAGHHVGDALEPVLDPELFGHVEQHRVQLGEAAVVHGGKQVVEQVVAEGGEHDGQRRLLHVPDGVDLVQAPVGVEAGRVAGVVQLRVVVGRGDAGRDQPEPGDAVVGQPVGERDGEGHAGRQVGQLDDGQEVLGQEPLLAGEDKVGPLEKLDREGDKAEGGKVKVGEVALGKAFVHRQEVDPRLDARHLDVRQAVGVQVVGDGVADPPVPRGDEGEVEEVPPPAGAAVALVEKVVGAAGRHAEGEAGEEGGAEARRPAEGVQEDEEGRGEAVLDEPGVGS